MPRPTPAHPPDASPWLLLVSFIPIIILAIVGIIIWRLGVVRQRNTERRAKVVELLEGDRKQKGGKKERVMVGFWHPYCNAGGGGERVLWTAISYLQRTHGDDVISLVYTGDYPGVGKKEILGKVKTRFGLSLSPSSIHFVPIPSRYLLSDTYWTRFTLVGQSLGSMWCALEGIGVVGKDGLWGDFFIDTMGYAFTYPVITYFTNSLVPIGAYIHYPIISEDMIARVRSRKEVGEGRGAKTRRVVKIWYYKIFTKFYSLALLFSGYTMTNSTWTQAHITALLISGRFSWLTMFMTFPEDADKTARALSSQASSATSPSTQKGPHQSAEPPAKRWVGSEIVYPPCDTAQLAQCGKLDKRERILVSLAQFRPEKEHATQLRALHLLFESHPEYRGSGPSDIKQKVKLVMMGSSRNDEDEKRIQGLKTLAKDLGIKDNVEFIINAPYSEIINWLGRASIGINTMVDEHFGINVVEFMAAGLIPLVHASAGPLLDIVVPLNGQRTGFHATDPASFATSMHDILCLSLPEQLRIRQTARRLAQERFSQEQFEKGWARGWKKMREQKMALEEAERERELGGRRKR